MAGLEYLRDQCIYWKNRIEHEKYSDRIVYWLTIDSFYEYQKRELNEEMDVNLSKAKKLINEDKNNIINHYLRGEELGELKIMNEEQKENYLNKIHHNIHKYIAFRYDKSTESYKVEPRIRFKNINQVNVLERKNKKHKILKYAKVKSIWNIIHLHPNIWDNMLGIFFLAILHTLLLLILLTYDNISFHIVGLIMITIWTLTLIILTVIFISFYGSELIEYLQHRNKINYYLELCNGSQ